MIDVFSKTFLGMTVSCARCHDHKFDAISTKDYYALVGVFASSGYRQVRFETDDRERDIARRLRGLEEKRARAIRAEIAAKLRDAVTRKPEALKIKLPDAVPANARVILNYADAAHADWRPDGAAFGDGPRKIGEVVSSGIGFRVNGLLAAVVDPSFLAIKCAGQNDPGDLGKKWRPGARSPRRKRL